MSVKLEVRTNRHPNLNGEPWGWVSGLAGMSIHWDGNEGRANADALASAHARARAAESARDAALAQAETDAAHHAAARAAHADLLRNHRAAMEGAEAEIGRLRGALEELNSAFTALREMGGVNCNCEGDYRCVDCWGIAAIDDARAALASTATVSVEPAHDCDGVACWVCADQHHAAVEAQAEALPSDKPDASAEGEGA